MVTRQTQGLAEPATRKSSIWASIGLIRLGGVMLSIAVIWRMVDQFVLNLGSTWMNILPSKMFPFLILLGFFWKYRPRELASVLGLSRDRIRAQLALGLLTGMIFAVGIDFGGTIVYALFFDAAYPLELRILNQGLLGYTLIFFLTNALLEETLFRGLLLNAFKTRFAAKLSIMLSAIVFGIWHAGWPIINGGSDVLGQVASMVFFTTILGILFGVYYERFSSAHSLVGPMTVHTLANFFSESFKLGPEPVIQGPDLAFLNSGLMVSTFLMFLVVFIPLIVFLWRFKIEQVTDMWQRVIGKNDRVTTGYDDDRCNNDKRNEE